MEETMIKKREDYISWDQYFMAIAKISALRSKDPSTQVGACIVNKDNKIISVGYNGAPTGLNDDDLPWNREGDFENTKYPYVCHAELNAILNNRFANLENTKIYVTLFPCNECAKAIVQAGIKTVIYESDKYEGTKENVVSKSIFEQCGVTCIKYDSKNKNININL